MEPKALPTWMLTLLTYDVCPTCPYECVENTSGQYYQAGVVCPICRRLRERYMKEKEKEMEDTQPPCTL